jgi:glutathione synthase/RimK-type ligase-like ATP-grasp enzyme
MKRHHYKEEEYDKFLARAIEFMKKKPDASRARVAMYAGVGISVLERFESEGKLTLPKPMTKKQINNKYKWQNTLGKL